MIRMTRIVTESTVLPAAKGCIVRSPIPTPLDVFGFRRERVRDSKAATIAPAPPITAAQITSLTANLKLELIIGP